MKTIQVWKLQCSPNKAFELMPYPASMLRGLFGKALLIELCHCAGEHHERCLYRQVFEGPSLLQHSHGQDNPAAYTFRVEAHEQWLTPDSTLLIELTLFGAAIENSQRIIQLFVAYLAKGHFPGGVALLCHGIQCEMASAPLQHNGHYQVSMLSPMLIKQNSKAIKSNELTVKAAGVAIARRVERMRLTHQLDIDAINFSELLNEIDHIEFAHDCQRVSWHRYSNRQNKLMPLSGLFGRMQFKNLPEQSELFKVLHWGQWLHGGGKTALGLGAYRLGQLG